MKQQNLGLVGGLGVGLLMILCPWVYRLPIERDLTVAAQKQLQQKNLGHWRVSFSGLHAILQGPGAEASLARQVVEQVPGVAQVTLLPLSVAAPTATPTPAPTPEPEPQASETPQGLETGLVQVLQHQQQVYLRGLYSDVQTRDALLQSTRVAFPQAEVRDESTLTTGEEMGWPKEVGKLLPLLRSVQDLEVLAGGDALILGGIVARAQDRERLGEIVRGHLPLGVTLENQLHLAGADPAKSLPPLPKAGESHPAEQAALDRVVRSGEVLFGTASSRLPLSAYAYLDRIASLLRAQAGTTILIGGHTDNQGDPETNLRLSQKRADAVRVYLITRGISIKRLHAKGYGAQKPLDSNETEPGRRRNRRITFDIR